MPCVHSAGRTLGAEGGAFSKHLLGIFYPAWMVLFGNCSALNGRRGRCWRNPTEHKYQLLLRSQKEGVCVPRKVCCSTEWLLLSQTPPVLIPWLMSVLLGFGEFCLGGVQYSVSPSGWRVLVPRCAALEPIAGITWVYPDKKAAFFSFICAFDTSLSARLTNFWDFV